MQCQQVLPAGLPTLSVLTSGRVETRRVEDSNAEEVTRAGSRTPRRRAAEERGLPSWGRLCNAVGPGGGHLGNSHGLWVQTVAVEER